MLKKMIVGMLATVVAVAIGVSIYNASAAPQIVAQVEAAAAAPVLQAHNPQAEIMDVNTASAVSESAQPDVMQAPTNQSQGARSGAGSSGYGSGRLAGQDAQTSQGTGMYAAEFNNGMTPVGLGQGAGGGQGASGRQGGAGGRGAVGASGRPAWAGQGQGRQP